MACNITEGIARGCRDNAGGIYTVYIANYPDGVVNPFDWDGATGDGFAQLDVTDIVTDFNNALITLYEFTPNKKSSEFVETYQTSLENGTVGYEQKLTAVFSKMEAAKRNQIKLLATGNSLIIIKDKNNRYWMMGAYDAAVLSGGNAGSGKALTDLNGYILEFTAIEGAPAFEVAEAAVIDVIA